MRLSQLVSKTKKTLPADEVSKNARLLIQAGFISKEMAGVYDYLPLGLKVVENLKEIVRTEMNILGGQELIMSSLQRKELWQETDRWDDNKVDIWFKSKLKNGTELGLAWSHEEPITTMLKEFISSYRDLPVYVYQFQTKMRNETRTKSGIMRCREFLMKDLYSYSLNEKDHKDFYDKVTQAYLNIFKKVGLEDNTFFTFASGGAFTKFSHEFQTLTNAGEDTIYVHHGKKIAINAEVLDEEVLKVVGVNKNELEKSKAAEVGNIFSFGTKKSEQLGLYFQDEHGQQRPVILGSYGIGITRLMGVIAEYFSDNKGLVWPLSAAPAKVYIARLGNSGSLIKIADELYKKLENSGIETLYDDRNVRVGEKFADADIMGIPYRVVVSDKTIESKKYEIKNRKSDKSKLVDFNNILDILKDKQALV